MNTANEIIREDKLLRKIVQAIVNANGINLRTYLLENALETNNALMMKKGDYINDNLRHQVVNDNIELIPFRRYGWEGRILWDHVNKITYTIVTIQTLKMIPKKKNRSLPHYLHSILFAENSKFEPRVKQLDLGDFGIAEPSLFDPEELLADYIKIVGNNVTELNGCSHYVVAYESSHFQVHNIELILLDKDFQIVDKESLNEFITPDFSTLTVPEDNSDEVEDIKSLINTKAGIKPKLLKDDKKA